MQCHINSEQTIPVYQSVGKTYHRVSSNGQTGYPTVDRRNVITHKMTIITKY